MTSAKRCRGCFRSAVSSGVCAVTTELFTLCVFQFALMVLHKEFKRWSSFSVRGLCLVRLFS